MQDLYINEVVKNLKKTRMEYGFRNENWRNTHGVKVDRNQALLCQLPHTPPAHFFMVVRILEPLKNSVSFGPISKRNLWIWKHFKNRWSDLQTLGVQSSLRSEGEYFCPKISDDLPSFAGIMCMGFWQKSIWTKGEEKCVISLIGYVSLWARE